MRALAALPRFRALAESRMTSRCTIRRKTGAFTTVAGQKVPTWTSVYTSLPTRVHTDPRASLSRTDEFAGVHIESAVRVESFPAGTVLLDGDMVDITTGDCAAQVLRVVDATPADQQTALRVKVVAAPRPPEWT